MERNSSSAEYWHTWPCAMWLTAADPYYWVPKKGVMVKFLQKARQFTPSPKLNTELQYLHCCTTPGRTDTRGRQLSVHPRSQQCRCALPEAGTTQPPPTGEPTNTQCGLSTQQNTTRPRKGNADTLQHEPWRCYAKWHEPGTKGPVLYDPTYRRSPERSKSKTENRAVVARGWRRGMGSLVFRRCSFHLGRWKSSAAEGGDGCTTVCTDSTPLNCTFKTSKRQNN